MSSANATQRKLIEATRQLVRQQGLEKTTVQEITDLAGFNRKTFYKYYIDKYELVNSICYDGWYEYERAHGMGNAMEIVKSIIQFLETDKVFFSHAVRETGQNTFGNYIISVVQTVIEVYLGELYRMTGTPEDEIELISNELARAAHQSLVFWLTRHPEWSAEEFYDRIESSMAIFGWAIKDFFSYTMKEASDTPDSFLSDEKLEELRIKAITKLDAIPC